MAKRGRGFLHVYRTYNFLEGDKNPIIDKVRTLVEDEGLFKRLGVVHELSGVSTSTLNNWFHGETRRPQHHTIAAVVTALGYEETFVKKRDLDVEKERKVAAAWLEKQERKPAAAKRNGKRK